ncbi:MAG: carbohydrate-binding domain-containing protein [Prevotella sp.]|nr:carbohydrate-binding domain-containing protein [Prevotella sp.]
MKRFIATAATALVAMAMTAQTLNVEMGQVTYQIPAAQAGEMIYQDGKTITIINKVYTLSDITRMYIDTTAVDDNTIHVDYDDFTSKVFVPAHVAPYVTVICRGGHVSILQSDNVDDNVGEITYALSGSSSDGEFYMTGSYKATVELQGLTLTNATPLFSGAAICIMDGKRIDLSIKRDTENTLTDAATGSQKAAIYCKGHLELKGRGVLNVYGKVAHAIKSAEYMELKNATINVKEAVSDGISCDEYFLMESGTLTIDHVGDDGLQCDIDGTTSTGELTDHEDEDSGNIYILGGTLNLTVTADGAKGIKAAGDIRMSDGSVNITQTGGITTAGDLGYPTSIKATGNISIKGGSITINNTADGGKGISADGAVTIDESSATTVIDITADGKGGTATITDAATGEEGDDTPQTSYVVYVSLPAAGGGGGGMGGGGSNAWTTLYLYKSDGTQVAQLTTTVTKTVGSTSTTFYRYDFGASDSGTYYFKSADYTSRGQGNRTYSIVSETFSGPTSGSDYYYTITNSYTTSGTTRTYKLTNVTATYSGSNDTSEDSGTSYNAMGIKADGNLTIGGGTVSVRNSGAMSKSLKSKATLTVNGGDITLTPSGAMMVVNNDASYSSAVKAVDFVQNGGSLHITASGTAGKGISVTNITTNGGSITIDNSGAPQAAASSDYYTAKGIKADSNASLLGGTIVITMTGNGGKGMKVNGTYVQGNADGDGPALTVSTTGTAAGSSSSGGWGGGMGGSLSGTAKGIKVMGTITMRGGTTEVSTASNGAEGLESKTGIDIKGGLHYFKCYDDCINSAGKITFDGGATVCYSFGNDAVDSNYGRTGAITIGDGAVFAYTTKGAPEEGLDCDNNSYIQISGNGYAISAGASQGGGGGGWGGSSTGSTISGATQGYAFVTNSISYQAGRYYTLCDANSQANLITYSFPAACNSSLGLFTAKGMVKSTSYKVMQSTVEPTDATTVWHGLYIGSTQKGSNDVTTFSAK